MFQLLFWGIHFDSGNSGRICGGLFPAFAVARLFLEEVLLAACRRKGLWPLFCMPFCIGRILRMRLCLRLGLFAGVAF